MNTDLKKLINRTRAHRKKVRVISFNTRNLLNWFKICTSIQDERDGIHYDEKEKL